MGKLSLRLAHSAGGPQERGRAGRIDMRIDMHMDMGMDVGMGVDMSLDTRMGMAIDMDVDVDVDMEMGAGMILAKAVDTGRTVSIDISPTSLRWFDSIATIVPHL